MSKIIIIASGKGGVGKTSVTAQLGISLAEKGKRVLLSDVDFGLRNLDIALGVQDSIVYDILDCVEQRCDFDDAIVSVSENLKFLPASQSRRTKYVEMKKVSDYIKSISDNFDYILLDSPAGIGITLEECAKAADEAFIVVRPFLSSVRDADRCIEVFEENGINKASLIINDVSVELIKSGDMMNPDAIADLLGTHVIGLIPHDEQMLKGVNPEQNSKAKKAFSNIAGRMLGEKIPVVELEEKKKGIGAKIRRILKF